jgi:hypothetical protein
MAVRPFFFDVSHMGISGSMPTRESQSTVFKIPDGGVNPDRLESRLRRIVAAILRLSYDKKNKTCECNRQLLELAKVLGLNASV